MGPGHADYPLYQQIRGHITALDAKLGREFDETSERLTASLVVLARENKLEQADHVVLSAATEASAAGQRIFVVQGNLNDPAHQRASMATELAVQTPVQESLQQLATVSQEQQLQGDDADSAIGAGFGYVGGPESGYADGVRQMGPPSQRCGISILSLLDVPHRNP